MRKIKIRSVEIKMHSREGKDTIKVIDRLLEQYHNKELHLKKASNGIFKMVNVSRNERLVLDSSNNWHYMTHEKYNNFLQKR
ncbi:MAG: hypothetical protein ACRC7W_00600 [Fusobacteriaceae bacterium]